MRKLFTLLICMELILSPLAPSLSVFGNKVFAEECQAGFVFDSSLNRCLTSAQTTAVMNATANCGQDVECYKTNAQDALQKEVAAGNAPERKGGGGLVSTVATIAAVAGPVTYASAGLSKMQAKCSSMSFYAMIAGAAALVIGDNLANMGHKKRLKKIKEDWGKIVNPEEAAGDKDKERTTSMEAQSQAFEMLARSEDSLATAANMKKTFFMVATLAYAASGVMSAMEISKNKALWAVAKAAPPAQKPTATATATQDTVATTCKSTPQGGEEAAPSDTDFSDVPADGPAVDSGSSASTFDFMKPGYLKEDSIFRHNLLKSEDLVSFVINKKEMDTRQSVSIDEYYELKKSFSDFNNVEPTVFEVFKAVSLTVLNNVSPLPAAHAEEAKSEVNTNAAKAYKEDKAKGLNLMSLGIGAAAGVAAGKLIGPKLVTPTGRMIYSGVMAGMTMIMATHAGSQAKASKKRAELLRKMKDDFASASGAVFACASADRNDPSKPSCYCYTAEGGRNSNRGSSTVCQNLWAGKDLTPGVYTASNNSDNTKVCITNQNQADATCACKSNNTCLKVGSAGITGLNPGTFSMLSQSLDPLNKIASGSVSAGSLDSAALGNQAARMMDLAKKAENTKGLEDVKKNKEKIAKQIQADLAKGAAGMNSGSFLGGSGSSGSGFPTSARDAAAMLEKEVEAAEINKIGGGPDSVGPGGDMNGGGLEFGLTPDQLATQETQIAEVMKQDLDYGQNDINNSSNTNIFEVLSNRYQRSGMRRLFDEKGVTKPDAASKTDITQ